MDSNSMRPFNSARLNARARGKRIIRASTAALSLLYRQLSDNRVKFAALQNIAAGCSNEAARFLCSTVFSLPPGHKKEPQSITHLHFDRHPACADRQKIINVNTQGVSPGKLGAAKYAKFARACVFARRKRPFVILFCAFSVNPFHFLLVPRYIRGRSCAIHSRFLTTIRVSWWIPSNFNCRRFSLLTDRWN